MTVLWRLLAEARAARPAVFGAIAVGAVAQMSAIGLMATSAWLISRAAEHPAIFELTIGVVAVRAFALGRATFRYTERLLSHDAAFRVLGGLRQRMYGRLDELAPALLPRYRRGDLLSRLVADIDTVQDL